MKHLIKTMAFTLLGLVLSSNVWALTSVAPANGKTVAIVAVTGTSPNEKYYALPQISSSASASTFNGVEISVNNSGYAVKKDGGAEVPTWTLVKNSSNANQYYISYSAGASTYYLYKNGTSSSSNYNIKVVSSSQHYWTFATSGDGYSIKSERGSAAQYLQLNSNKKFQVSGTQTLYLLELAPSFTITAQSNNTTYGTVSLSGNVITASPKAGYTYDYPAYTVTSGSAEVEQDGDKFTVKTTADCTVRINFAIKQTATIKLSEAGIITDGPSGKYSGDQYTLPTTCNQSCGDKTFVGWSTETVDSETKPTANTYHEPGEEVTLAANNTFYAVFADEGEDGGVVYQKVSSVSEGRYVLVSEKTSGTYKYMPSTESAGSNPALGSGITMTTSGGVTKLTNSVTDAMLWDLTSTGTTNEYYIRPKGSTTIGLGTTTSTGGNIRISGTYKDTKWTITTSTNYNWQFKNNNTTAMYLAVYADNAWRNYSNSTTNQNGKFYLFKEESNITYSNYTTTCAAPRDIDHIEVTGTPATFWKGDEFNHTGMTVKAYYTEGDPDDVTGSATYSGYDMSVAGEQTVTVTYKSKTDTYEIDVKTIANTAETAYTTAKAIEIIDAGKDLATQVYVTGTVSKVNGYYSNKYITYFLDEDAFEIYNGLGKEGAAFSSQDDIQVDDEVVVYGQLTKFGSTYELAADNQLVSLTRPKKLTSITVSGTPDYFDTQSSFNHNGMTVTAHYNTGASDDADVTASAVFTAPDMTTQGEKTVNVSYTENEITKETSYKIQVAQYCANVVTITKGDEENGTFSLSQTGNICADGGLTISVTNIVPAEHYHFKQITATNGDVDDNAKTVSNITANTTINVEFEEDEKVTVKWHVGTAAPVETADVYVGTAFADVKANAPTVADNAAGDCANKFMGWATSAITAQDGVDEDDVAWATEPISNENKDFYAVFATESAGGVATTEELTKSEIQSITNSKLVYTTEKTYSGSTLSYSIYGNTDNASRPWIQLKKDQSVYIKVTAPEDIKQIELTITSASNSSGGIADISKHTAYSGSVGLVTTDCTFSTDSKNVGITSTITNNKATITTTESTKEVMIKVTTGARIWGIKTTYGAGTTYSDYVTSCIIPTATITAAVEAGQEAIGSVAIYNDVPEAVTNPYTFNKGDDFMLEASISDDAYRFKEWTMSEGSDITLEDATDVNPALVAGAVDVIFTAHFELIPTQPRTVKFNAGELGTYDGGDITEEEAEGGITLPAATPNDKYHAFVGWSTSSSAETADAGTAGEKFTPTEDNQTLYAVYARLYKVVLKDDNTEYIQYEVGDYIWDGENYVALPTRTCKNEAYTFAGWSETNCATETTFNPGLIETEDGGYLIPTKDLELYPIFTKTEASTKWTKQSCAQVTEGVYALLASNLHAFNGSTTSGQGATTADAFVFDANNIATSVPTGICEITMQPVVKNEKVVGYKMYNAENGYLYAKAAKSGNLAWHDTEESDWCVYNDNWEYYDNYAYLRSATSSGTTYLRTYSKTSDGDAALQFARKDASSTTYYNSKPANDVVNPELDLAAGDYLAPQTIKITSATYQSGYAYRYTTDGSAPSKSSTVYDHESGIKLETANTYTVKVIGYDEDNYETQIASATYVLYPVFTSISAMYTGAVVDKPVGLALTNAYVHAVNTIGVNSQIFVQQGDLGVVLSTTSVPEGVEAGKKISGTAIGTYEIKNDRPQISKFAFQSTFMVEDGSRPEPTTITETTADLVSTHLLRLVKLEGVYAQSDANNIIVVNSNAEGTGTSMNVYDFFNKVSTIPASDVKCNVIGLFNERKDGSNPIVYSIMPILDNDFDVVEKQNAQLPEVKPAGGASEGEALPVANEEIITITPAAGFTTSYRMNGAEWIPITTQYVQPTIVEENTTLEVKAIRPYYNDASATYFYHIDAGLTKYPITLPSPQTYVKTETDLASAKAGDKVTITISQKVARYWETSVTVVKTDEESVTTDVTSEGNHVYSFIMPAYPVTVKVNYADAPKVDINYNKGDGTGIEGEMPQEHAYIGDEYQLSDCAFHAAGLTFTGWKAYKTGDKETPVAINDNKIIVPDYNVSVEAQWDMAPWKKEGTWELVTKTSELGVGDYVIFTETIYAGTETARQAGTSTVKGAGKNLATTTNISISSNKLSRLNNDGSMVFQVETGNVENTYAFYADGIGYLNANGTSTNNYMITTESKESTNASWAVESIDATTGEAVVKAKSENRNMMQVNVSNSIFAAYGSKQGGLAIYKFYPKAWTVTFDDNVEDEEIAVPEMQRADPTTNKVTISDMIPVRTGYDFSIWNSAKGGTGVTSANPTDEITLSANTTLYAQWNIKQYNVAVAEVENVTIQAKPYSEEVIAEGGNANVNFKKSVVLSYSDLHEDYVFKSWKVTKADDETTVVPVSVGSSTTFEVPAYAVTVSAIIESKATTQLTVTYHANGGKNKTAGDPEEVSEQVNWNTTIKFAEHPCPFEKNLCTFAGWNTKADGTGTTYKTQVTVKSDIDLYAMWEASAVEYVIDDNVEAKVKVQEGVAPTGSAATFVTTYMGTFGQLTNTHKGTLTLTGYAGKVITGVKMQMRSNGSSGAGTIVIKVGDKEICSTSYAESFGSHSSSYSVAELANFNAAIIGETENITIVVSCTDNSLYIKGYTIEYTDPEIIRNELAVDQYTTFCWPKTIPANAYTGATFWNIESKTTMADGRLSSITIVQHEGDLEAGVPYIMYNTATEFKCYQTGEAVDAPAAEGNNGLVGVFEITMFDTKIRPVTDDADAAARGIYIISDGTLYLCGNNCGVYANRAYIVNGNITDQSAKAPAHAARRTIGNPNGTPTNLNGLNGNVKAQKALIDGHIYIIRENKMYNAQGLFVK